MANVELDIMPIPMTYMRDTVSQQTTSVHHLPVRAVRY